MKYNFTGEEDDCEIRLPRQAGVTDDELRNIEDRVLTITKFVFCCSSETLLTITSEQMLDIFNPCVHRTLELIDGQVAAVIEKYKKKPKVSLGRYSFVLMH